MADSPGEDSALVERAREGDTGAYADLVRRYQDLAFRTAYVITGGADAAEDAAQEAFVKAYYALAGFHTGAPFRPWLLRIVANEARNRRKADGRRAALALRAAQSQPASAPSPEAAALAGERRATLLRALDRLREEDRLVIAYRYLLALYPFRPPGPRLPVRPHDGDHARRGCPPCGAALPWRSSRSCCSRAACSPYRRPRAPPSRSGSARAASFSFRGRRI